MRFLTLLEGAKLEGVITHVQFETLKGFYKSYQAALIDQSEQSKAKADQLMVQLFEQIAKNVVDPFQFEPFHQAIRSPFDYYSYGIDFIRPIVTGVKLQGHEQLDAIQQWLKAGDNVILLANHQSELDPQVISLVLEKTAPRLAESMIFVAGHRVTSDPLAIPFSMGRNLLCIYSKRHLESDPHLKEKRVLHNQRTMKLMSQLLSEGGKVIYVAPSGGRDRPNPQGIVEVAPLDPQSLELFWLMAKAANRKTHFVPLALSSYALLPPPDTVLKELGERREVAATELGLAFGREFAMETDQGEGSKQERRQARAMELTALIAFLYKGLVS